MKAIAQLFFVQSFNEDFQIVEEILQLIPTEGETDAVEDVCELVTLSCKGIALRKQWLGLCVTVRRLWLKE
jgi:hypothetical protein